MGVKLSGNRYPHHATGDPTATLVRATSLATTWTSPFAGLVRGTMPGGGILGIRMIIYWVGCGQGAGKACRMGAAKLKEYWKYWLATSCVMAHGYMHSNGRTTGKKPRWLLLFVEDVEGPKESSINPLAQNMCTKYEVLRSTRKLSVVLRGKRVRFLRPRSRYYHATRHCTAQP